ncbi:MAG TPA: S41 family peptidase, partial [Chitinophagaceae bacterium]|nr:S41 family peptidase [Chitinophagaceae bacterium]
IGYIKFRQFTEGSAADFKDAFQSLQQNTQLDGLIVDLRGNPGGLLREAVRMSNFFLPLGDTIVSVRGRSEIWNEVYTAIQKPIDTLIPLVVLINRRSASAAEIFAGAMQDLDRGVIVGRKSFGKGLVQGTRELPYHSELKLTVGRYYTPSGRCIQKLDYHHRDKYGSPIKVIDSIQKDFTTTNGRIVHNNGGITPDKLINQRYLSNLSNALINNNLIFLFAARYIQLHPVAPELGQFQVSDSLFRKFKHYVGKHSLAYRSRGEQLLERIKADAIGAGYYDSVESNYNKLALQIRKYTHPALKEKKQEISELLAREIMNCYYRLPGKTAANLSQSPVIDTAIGILRNRKRYEEILR